MSKQTENKKIDLKKQEELLEKELERMDNIEYGMKELLQGIAIGTAIGFALAWFLFNK